MIICCGYYYFMKHGGIIIRDNLTQDCRGILSRIGERPIIQINKNDSLEEQVITVLHEFVHIGIEYPGILYSCLPEIDPVIEQKVETKTQAFYQRNSPLAGKIREMLQQLE